MEIYSSMETAVWQADRIETCRDDEVFDEMREAVRQILSAEGTPLENDQCMFRLKDVMDARLKLITLPEEDENSLRSNTSEIVTVRRLRAYQKYRQEKISLHECINQSKLEWQKTFMTEKEIQLSQKMKDYFADYDPKTNTRIVPKFAYKPFCEEIENWKHLFPTSEERQEEAKKLTTLETFNLPMSSRDIEDPTTPTHQLKKRRLMYPEYEAEMDIKELTGPMVTSQGTFSVDPSYVPTQLSPETTESMVTFQGTFTIGPSYVPAQLSQETTYMPGARIGQSEIPRTSLLANKLAIPRISLRPPTIIGQSEVPLKLSKTRPKMTFLPPTRIGQSEVPLQLSEEMTRPKMTFLPPTRIGQFEVPLQLSEEMTRTKMTFLPPTRIGQSEVPLQLSEEMVTAISAVHIPEWTKTFEPKEPEIPAVQKTLCATFSNRHKVLLPKGTKISALDEGYMLKRSDSF